jgi:hypothetical protein
MFKNIGACHIRECDRYNKKEDPPCACLPEIDYDECSKENIKWSPMCTMSQERHDRIKNRVGEHCIYLEKKPVIQLFQLLPPGCQ